MDIPIISSDSSSGYIIENTLIHLPADNSTSQPTTKFVTVLVDPRGDIPVGCGALPLKEITLAPGPVDKAVQNIEITFRTGPLLTDPTQLTMPLPGEVSGKWSWIHRTGVTMWQENANINSQQTTVMFNGNIPVLEEGWLKLKSGLTSNTPREAK